MNKKVLIKVVAIVVVVILVVVIISKNNKKEIAPVVPPPTRTGLTVLPEDKEGKFTELFAKKRQSLKKEPKTQPLHFHYSIPEPWPK